MSIIFLNSLYLILHHNDEQRFIVILRDVKVYKIC